LIGVTIVLNFMLFKPVPVRLLEFGPGWIKVPFGEIGTSGTPGGVNIVLGGATGGMTGGGAIGGVELVGASGTTVELLDGMVCGVMES
jgi:hypothetical protein